MTAIAESFAPVVSGHLAELRGAGLLRQDLYIDGEWVPAADGARLDVYDPASGEVVGRVASATPEDVRRAVAAATPLSRRIRAWLLPVSTLTATQEGLQRLGDMLSWLDTSWPALRRQAYPRHNQRSQSEPSAAR